jgi:hypothetical protein
LKFAQGGGDIEKPKKRKSKSDNENESKNKKTPNQNSETETSKTGANAELKQEQKVEPKATLKTETFEPQRFAEDSEKTVSKEELKTDSKTATILKLETQFFPYEKHVKNARQSFKRAFDESRKPQTIQNRMATAQQHINALLFEGFNVWVDKKEPSLLRFDKLKKPSLKPQTMESLVGLKNGVPTLEKFEFEEILSEVG